MDDNSQRMLQAKYSLREALLTVSLVGILLAYTIQIHREATSDAPSIPWPILMAYIVWLMFWLRNWYRTSRQSIDNRVTIPSPGKLLFAVSATVLIANGIALVVLSGIWARSPYADPNPIGATILMMGLFWLLTLVAILTLFYPPMRRNLFYWGISTLMLLATCPYNGIVLVHSIPPFF